MSEAGSGLPLHERRGEAIDSVIAAAFADLQTEFPAGYKYHGLSNAYEFLPFVSTSTLINDLRETRNPLRVLDVGAGAGGFVSSSDWQPDDTVHGISAYDYRRETLMADRSGLARSARNAYLIGNAERLESIPGLLPRYDLVVSKWMLKHLIEPIGALEQMTNKVAVGGLIAFDRFRWRYPPGKPNPTLSTLLDGLEQGGFSLDLEYQKPLQQTVDTMRDLPGIPDMIIRRTDDQNPVRFAVQPVLGEPVAGAQFPRAIYTTLE